MPTKRAMPNMSGSAAAARAHHPQARQDKGQRGEHEHGLCDRREPGSPWSALARGHRTASKCSRRSRARSSAHARGLHANERGGELRLHRRGDHQGSTRCHRPRARGQGQVVLQWGCGRGLRRDAQVERARRRPPSARAGPARSPGSGRAQRPPRRGVGAGSPRGEAAGLPMLRRPRARARPRTPTRPPATQ